MNFIEAPDGVIYALLLTLFFETAELMMMYAAALSIRLEKKRRVLLVITLLTEYYILSTLILGVKAYKLGGDMRYLEKILQIKTWHVAVIVIFFLGLNLFYMKDGVAWWKKHISADAVKQSMDGMETGICYYKLNGRFLLANKIMNDISTKLFEKNLYDGLEFEKDIGGTLPCTLKLDDRTFELSKTVIDLEGTSVYELRANDITEENDKSEQLKNYIEEQKRMGKRIRNYGTNVDKIAREEEILEAKINVHDELGQALIRAKHFLQTGEDENSEEIFTLCERALSLLRNEGTNAGVEINPRTARDSDRYNNLLTAARDVGIDVTLMGKVPTEKTAFDVFIKALHTSITNAMKHAESKNLYIDVKETYSEYFFFFTNDGLLPSPEFAEGGGLSHLREYVEKNGGTMKIFLEPPKVLNTGFTLSVKMPKILVN